MNNTIYTLEISLDTEEVGKSLPQLGLSEFPAYKHYLNNVLEPFPDYKDTIEFTLMQGANWTDLLGQYSITGYKSIVISSELKKILSGYDICPHKYYDAKIKEEKSKNTKDYFWLSLDWLSGALFIDYSKSTFCHYERKTFIEKKSFAEREEFKTFLKEKCIWPFRILGDQVSLIDANLPDMFTMPFDKKIYLNEILAKKLISEKITGINISRCLNVNIRSSV